jgi:O-antigen ligase
VLELKDFEEPVFNQSNSSLAICPVGFCAATRRRETGELVQTVTVWLLSALVFILPTDLRLWNGKSIAMRLGYACILLGIAGVFKRRSAVLPGPGFWILFCFVLWSSCTLAWARYPEFAGKKILFYWALFAICAILPQYAWDPGVRSRLLNAYVAGCWLGVFGTVANFVLGRSSTQNEVRYSFGTDPNYLALGLVIGIPLAVYGASTLPEGWRRKALIYYPPCGVIGVLVTGSRGALVALLSLALIYAVFATRRVRVMLLSGAALCAALALVLPSQISERFASIPEELQHGTLSDRRQLWEAGAAIVREHPLQGIGAGATQGEFSIAAHNTALELMMEGGAVSVALLYGALLIGLARMWRHDRRQGRFLLAASIAWFIGSLSLSWESQTVTWFLIGIVNSTLPGISLRASRCA